MPKDLRPSLPVPLEGKVRAFNISPKGHIEGALVETMSGTVQINFPKHAAAALAEAMHVGADVHVAGELVETEDGTHPVYLAADTPAEVTGTITRLNYGPHGQVNGYHLDDGSFLHVKPERAKKHRLHVGDEVMATGARCAGADACVIEVALLKEVGRRQEARAQA